MVDKESQNLHAELMLRTVARERTGDGSLENGMKEMRAFLSGIGIDSKQYRFGRWLRTFAPYAADAAHYFWKLLLLYVQLPPYRGCLAGACCPIAGEDGSA